MDNKLVLIAVITWLATTLTEQQGLVMHANMDVTTVQVQPNASNVFMECI
jgi:hypothetical protein